MPTVTRNPYAPGLREADPFAAWTPRPADDLDALPSPQRSPRADEHVRRGHALRAERDAVEVDRQAPRRPMIGPALAARLGVPATTPPL